MDEREIKPVLISTYKPWVDLKIKTKTENETGSTTIDVVVEWTLRNTHAHIHKYWIENLEEKKSVAETPVPFRQFVCVIIGVGCWLALLIGIRGGLWDVRKRRERERTLSVSFSRRSWAGPFLYLFEILFLSTITEWFKASAEMEERDDGVSSEVRVFFKPFV